MAWKVSRVREIKRTVKVNEAQDGTTVVERTMTVGMKIYDMDTDRKLRQEILDEKPAVMDPEFEHLKRNVVTSIGDGPIDEHDKPYSLEEILWMGNCRTGIRNEYEAVSLGLRRKN